MTKIYQVPDKLIGATYRIPAHGINFYIFHLAIDHDNTNILAQ